MNQTIASLKRIPLAVDAVCFDMDGVVTNTMPLHARAWKVVLQRHGISLDPHTIYLHEGQKGMAFLKEMFGQSIPDSVLSQWLDEKETFFKTHAHPKPLPGVISLMRALIKKGIRLALVTGTSREETTRLLPEHIRKCFSVVVTGDDVTEGKPSPQPYLLAIKRLGVSPHAAVVIENAPFGIQAAREAGLRVIALRTTLPEKFLNEADLIFKDISVLTKRIRFMKIKDLFDHCRAIVVTKSSTYERILKGRSRSILRQKSLMSILERFKAAHQQHYATLKKVEAVLRARGVSFQKLHRHRLKPFKQVDLIVSVGGDGTVLSCAQISQSIPILGVNSAPPSSVGRFCAADAQSFPYLLDAWANGVLKPQRLMRLNVQLKTAKSCRLHSICALNDVLVAEDNPAAMSHYMIEVRGLYEEQKCSGLWIATPAGSTGAMASAGGRVLPLTQKTIQYKPRELYPPDGRYLLIGDVLPARSKIRIRSLMKNGRIYWDGPHHSMPFCFGDDIIVDGTASPALLLLVSSKQTSNAGFKKNDGSVQERIGLLVVSHGSRSKKLPVEMQRLVRVLKTAYPKFVIQPAYLELQKPDIPQGFEQLVKQGVKAVIVVMNFLNAGRHTDEDVPRLLKKLNRRHPDVHLKISPPLGRTPYWPQVFLRLVDKALSS